MNSIDENNLKLGIIGYPLSHTLSPQIHGIGLNYTGYQEHEILEVDDAGLDRLFCDKKSTSVQRLERDNTA